jgi:hypothetical protein
MAFNYKVLAQDSTGASNTNIYTAPANSQVIISTITVANISASAGTYRIAIRPDGAALANKHYIAYDVPIAANNTIALTLGLTIDAGDVITTFGSTSSVVFNLYGSEII